MTRAQDLKLCIFSELEVLEFFKHLDKLKKSRTTIADQYLIQTFGLGKSKAKEIFDIWQKTYTAAVGVEKRARVAWMMHGGKA